MEKNHRKLVTSRVPPIGFLILLLLIAGCKGCKKITEPCDPPLGSGTNISNIGGGPSKPAIAVSSEGNVHVVWTEQFGEDLTTEEIYYTMRSQNGSWSEAVNLSNNDNASRFPSIAVDRNDQVHVTWQDASPDGITWKLFYTVKHRGDSWSVPDTLVFGGVSSRPRIAIDEAGTTHMIWIEYLAKAEVFYASRNSDGSWSEPVNLSEFSEWPYFSGKSIDADPVGNVHVVWGGLKESFHSEVVYTMKPVAGTWSTCQNISKTEGYSDSPSIVADISGDLHVVWEDDTEIVDGFNQLEIYYTRRTAGGEWTSPVDISILRRVSQQPCLAADLQGNLHLLWHTARYEFRVYYAIKRIGADWSGPIFLSRPQGSPAYPALTVDSQGRGHAVWQEGHLTGNIFYFEFNP